jgi:hypothetical protein
MWWFEVFDTVRRLILSSVLMALLPGTASQIAIGMIVSVISLCVVIYRRPYLEDMDNHLAWYAQLHLFFCLFAALLVRVKASQTDEYNLRALGFIMILFTTGIYVWGAWSVIYVNFLADFKSNKMFAFKKKKRKGLPDKVDGSGSGIELDTVEDFNRLSTFSEVPAAASVEDDTMSFFTNPIYSRDKGPSHHRK